MTDQEGAGERRRGLRTGRVEAFSDGVFAIAITLLVLDLSIPTGSGSDLLTAFAEQWPAYLAYVVGFATIGAAWVAHTAITDFIDRADSRFTRLNLLLLLVVSFLAFPTRVAAEYIRDEQAVRVAVTILGINLFVIAALISVLWRHAVRKSLVRPDIADDEVRILTRRLTPSLGGYVALIALGLFLPIVAVVGYLTIALVLLLPLRTEAST